MSVFERLLVPGCTELPECRCGKEMQILRTHRLPKSDADIRVYNCPACHHEMRLAFGLTTQRLSAKREMGHARRRSGERPQLTATSLASRPVSRRPRAVIEPVSDTRVKVFM